MENSLLSGLLKKGPQRRGGLGAEKGAEEDRQPCGRTGWKSTFDGKCGCAEQPGGIPSEGARAMEEGRGASKDGAMRGAHAAGRSGREGGKSWDLLVRPDGLREEKAQGRSAQAVEDGTGDTGTVG